MTNQKYEDYWKITLAYTNIYSDEFNKVLNIIVNFIDTDIPRGYYPEKYKKLQEIIQIVYPKSDASIRKVVNTYIKLGFINVRLESYPMATLSFLRESAKEKKKTTFSKIVYSNSSFNRTVTNDSNKREVNFLVRTLHEVGYLDKSDVLGLMTKNISLVRKGYLNREELELAKAYANAINLRSRKYNQLSHLWSILKKLDNLVEIKNNIYLQDDAAILGLETLETVKKRDPYLQIIYKNQLKEECEEKIGKKICMVELLDYPALIASHIKPFIISTNEEAYDPNNGLLLSKNMDSLFDTGLITFKADGTILLSKTLSKELINYLTGYSLDSRFINEKRKAYLEYHRKSIFIK